MKYALSFFALFLLISVQIRAQHCAFDVAYIIVVHVEQENDSACIPGLKMTIADSLGRSVTSLQPTEYHWRDDTLRFWQNPKKTTHGGTINNEHPMNPWTIRFWFARDNYIYVTGPNPPGRSIKIEDIDGHKNGGCFDTFIIDLTKDELYPLCSLFSKWRKGPKFGFVENFKPITVVLQEK